MHQKMTTISYGTPADINKSKVVRYISSFTEEELELLFRRSKLYAVFLERKENDTKFYHNTVCLHQEAIFLQTYCPFIAKKYILIGFLEINFVLIASCILEGGSEILESSDDSEMMNAKFQHELSTSITTTLNEFGVSPMKFHSMAVATVSRLHTEDIVVTGNDIPNASIMKSEMYFGCAEYAAEKGRYIKEKGGPLTGYQRKVRDGFSEELMNKVFCHFECNGQSNRELNIYKVMYFKLAILLSVFVCAIAQNKDITLKAASLKSNCGCQCNNYIFRDNYGKTQGNCNTVDKTGAKWCYVSRGNTCNDLVPLLHVMDVFTGGGQGGSFGGGNGGSGGGSFGGLFGASNGGGGYGESGSFGGGQGGTGSPGGGSFGGSGSSGGGSFGGSGSSGGGSFGGSHGGSGSFGGSGSSGGGSFGESGSSGGGYGGSGSPHGGSGSGGSIAIIIKPRKADAITF
ncbi:unnamed protein product [Lepeophtheirus salmonis]|uniref:(salmon louse) hypothetical protein n=1 Tax=Lepeophtheirus salmonis TaxID=72036 RepID=A0A7R8HAF1_LEPSM|nr:unnamed protein product [Lepeophtheirus salmonis]CAF2966005.1 unnamed protein product [Lepeophtheirus salmonis]